MRILIVTQYFWPENFRINDMVAGLVELGYKVTVLTGHPNYPGGCFFEGYGPVHPIRETFSGARILRVPIVPRGAGGSLRLFLNFLSFALMGALIGPLMVRGRFDAILVYEPSPITVGVPAMVLKEIKGAPLLFWVQDLWPESLSATGAVTSRWILAMVELLVRLIYSRCDRILVQSEAFKAPIMRLGVASDKLAYFPNSAEALYCPVHLDADAKEQKLMPGGFRVMFAGNIGEAQDFPTILQAAERLKSHADIHFIILGSGRKQPWVKAQIAVKGLEGTVHLLGRHAVEYMPRFFSLADVMLVTLKKDPIFERTIPAKIQSYMACSKPVVAALEGEGARILKISGAGLSCPAEDPDGLARIILEMYGLSKKERDQMGASGMCYFQEHFERTRLLDKLARMFLNISRRK